MKSGYLEKATNPFDDRGGRRLVVVDDLVIHEKYLQEVLKSEILAALYEYPSDC